MPRCCCCVCVCREEKYEWLQKFETVKEPLQQWIRPDDTVLHIGCGTSCVPSVHPFLFPSFFFAALGNDVFQAKMVKRIVNMDFSAVCIAAMRERYGETDDFQWRVMDLRRMDVPDASFDVVLDKAALDALLPREIIGEDPDPDAQQAVDEIYRVLKPGGKYLQISFGQPHMRRKYFQPLHQQKQQQDGEPPAPAPEGSKWQLNLQTIGEQKGFLEYFLYVWTKL
eukprot:TRINITY_DN10143_c0_g1_i2.p1 TRINITY_DN10143_c0_g1~~TRINITY_DN10143_c0_g1_i2.p1  ORF type:complete len:225 (-),score=54.53 TRINITY_DN10143_c0_g1_i2:36-710(-)